MKLYLSGPMSGYRDHNRDAFTDAAAWLRDTGYEVINPAELGQHDGWAHSDYMRRDLPFIFEAQGVAVLAGAEYSAGAQAEITLGRALGLDVMPVHAWATRSVPDPEPVRVSAELIEPPHVSVLDRIRVDQAAAEAAATWAKLQGAWAKVQAGPVGQ